LSARWRAGSRQLDGDHGAAAGLVPRGGLPSVGLGDGLHDGQAQARAAVGAGAPGIGPGKPTDACGLAETARVVRYLADSSAGQCGPCLFGLDAVAGKVEQLARGEHDGLPLLRRWLGQVDGRGACSHPDGAVRLVRSALRVFASELDQHNRGWCCGTRTDPVLPVPPGGTGDHRGRPQPAPGPAAAPGRSHRLRRPRAVC
jgi:NADH-ubiquinone oxidoreductase-F iron-sulfur binding region